MDECFTFIPLSFESDFLVCKSEMGMQFLINHLNESCVGTELGFFFFQKVRNSQEFKTFIIILDLSPFSVIFLGWTYMPL